MFFMDDELVMKECSEEDVDYLFFVSVDFFFLLEDESESGDIFNVSCYSNYFKRMKVELD